MDDRVARLEKRVRDLDMLVRDIQIDVAAIVRELRVELLPNLLPSRPARVGHRAVLSPEARVAILRNNAAKARASKAVGTRVGNVRDPATRRRLNQEIE